MLPKETANKILTQFNVLEIYPDPACLRFYMQAILLALFLA